MKYRRQILENGVELRLKELLFQKAEELGVEISDVKITPDTVSLLISTLPQYPVHKAVKGLKRYTSGVLRAEYDVVKTKVPSLWTNSYFVTTIGAEDPNELETFLYQQSFVSKTTNMVRNPGKKEEK